MAAHRAYKTPVNPAVGKTVGKVAAENGAMVRVAGHTVMVSPPLIATADEVDTILSAIDAGLRAASNV